MASPELICQIMQCHRRILLDETGAFQGLMTGLIYNKPEDPINFLESAISRLRTNPSLALKWDSFVEFCPEPKAYAASAANAAINSNNDSNNKPTAATQSGTLNGGTSNSIDNNKTSTGKKTKPRAGGGGGSTSTGSGPNVVRTNQTQARKGISQKQRSPSPTMATHHRKGSGADNSAPTSRSTSLARAAAVAQINDYAPIILFIGGPGGGKTRYAARLREEMAHRNLVHICMPDLVRQAVARYKDVSAEWKLASERYHRGELIPNNLAQDLVKAEMGRHPRAAAYLLEGFPREARQVEDFERNVRPINMAMILDYDEEALRSHMQARGLTRDVIDRRIREFTHKTLPSARYFDDQRILHLIPGEKSSNVIFERMLKLVTRAMEAGVDVQTTTSAMSDLSSSPMASAVEHTDERNFTDTPTQEKANGTKSSSVASSSPIMLPATTTEKTNSLAQAVVADTSSIPSETETSNVIAPAAAAVSPPTSTFSLAKDLTAPFDATKTESSAAETSVNQASSPIFSQAQQRINSDSADSMKSEKPTQRNRQVNRPTSSESTSSTTISMLMTEKSTRDSPLLTDGISRTAAILEKQQQAQADVLSPPLVQLKTEDLVSKSVKPVKEDIRSKARDIETITTDKSSFQATKMTKGNDKMTSKNVTAQPTETGETVAIEIKEPVEETYDTFPKRLSVDVPIILVIGAPGSNKSELAERVARKYDGFVHVSMGTLFRRKVAENADDELWARVGRKMDAGEVIPMKICRELLYTTLHELNMTCRGFIVEGYPRTLPQAEDFETQLGYLDVAILIDCTEQYCRDTLCRRLQKSVDESTAQRNDDEDSIVRQRLSFFKQNTLPMLKYLDDKGKLRVVRMNGGGRHASKSAYRVNARADGCISDSDKSANVIHHYLSTDKIEGDTNLDNVFQEMIDAIDGALNAGAKTARNGSASSGTRQQESAGDDDEKTAAD